MKHELRTGAVTIVGRVRAVNQDAVIAAPLYAAVADGMGGHAGGEIASEIAVDTLNNSLRDRSIDTLIEAVRSANWAIYQRASDEPALYGMGTTLCAIALVEIEGHERVGIINVGDSRVYMMQDGRLIQITRDHSYVEELREAGEITAEEARNHPRRNIVTRALGIEADVDVDSWEVTPFVGDRYLLCSDGLFNEIDVTTIEETLRTLSDPQAAAERLTKLANEAGGRDNISVIVADVIERDESAGALGVAVDDPVPMETTAQPLGGWLENQPTMTMASVPTPTRPPDLDDTDALDGAGERTTVQTAARSPWRAGLFTGALVGILAIAAVSIWWYARASYYVTFDDNGLVTVYQGRPEGLLWFDPTLVRRYPLQRGQIFDQSIVRDLDSGRLYGSRASAEQYATTLTNRLNPIPTTTTPATTTIPATTIAPTTTIAPATTVAPTTTAPAPPPSTEPSAPTTAAP